MQFLLTCVILPFSLLLYFIVLLSEHNSNDPYAFSPWQSERISVNPTLMVSFREVRGNDQFFNQFNAQAMKYKAVMEWLRVADCPPVCKTTRVIPDKASH